MVKRTWRLLALLLIAPFLAPSSARFAAAPGFADQEKPPAEKKKYKLAVQYAKKEVVEKERKALFALEGKGVAGSGGDDKAPTADIGMDSETSEKYTDTVLEITEIGAMKKAKREYASSVASQTIVETEVSPRTHKGETPFDGKTLLIERKDDPDDGFEVVIEGSKEDFLDKAKQIVTLDEQASFLLPVSEMAVGDTWNPTEASLKKYLMGTMPAGRDMVPVLKIKSLDGTAECKLKEVIEEETLRRAVISYKVEAEIDIDPKGLFIMLAEDDDDEESPVLQKMSFDGGMNTKLTGEFEICLISAKLVRYEVSGSFSMEVSSELSMGEIGSVKATIKGKGTMEKKETWKVSREE